MLVLSRKQGERVVIETECGTTIVVTACDIRSHSVRIGFDAPKTTRINREEVRNDGTEK